MGNLSAVIITRNEERNLATCLSSLKGVTDEIIVIDSESTDKTKEIALAYGARFFTHPFEGYGAQKNWGADQASYDQILSIDADEALSPTLQVSVLQVKSENFPLKFYSMPRLNNYCGAWIKHCGWYPDVKVRIYPKNDVKWSADKVHERLLYNVPKSTAIRLKGDLLHYSYHTKEDQFQKLEEYSRRQAEMGVEKGKRYGYFIQWTSTIAKFITVYLFKLGFLDRMAGLKISYYAAYGTFLKYKILGELLRKKTSNS